MSTAVLQLGETLHCTVCTTAMPVDRLARGCTECSPACKTVKRRIHRRLRNARKCQYCGRGIPKGKRAPKAAAETLDPSSSDGAVEVHDG
jgi:predicted nucleic acid-binding Zn ribbon protein